MSVVRLLHVVTDVGPVTRDAAQRAAREELSKPAYHHGDPSLIDRGLRSIADWVSGVFDKLLRITPGGGSTLLILLAVLVAIVVAVRLGLGPLRTRDRLLDDKRPGAVRRRASDYRVEADRLAAEGDWREAIRARMRAVAKELEERGVLDPRPGRTAAEYATDAGRAVPAVAADLRVAATVFDEVWYGDRSADAARYRAIADADERVRGARLAVAVPA